MMPKDDEMEEQFEQIRSKRSLLIQSGQRSVAGSLGGLQEFYSHLGKLSNVSEILARKNSLKAEELKYDSAEESVSSISTRTSDVTSIVSNETRYSFLPYHTHDALKEFFYLTALCVKVCIIFLCLCLCVVCSGFRLASTKVTLFVSLSLFVWSLVVVVACLCTFRCCASAIHLK